MKEQKNLMQVKSISTVSRFKSDEYYALQNLGYDIQGITFAEHFNYSYEKTTEAAIPLEYTVYMVDERVPIYSSYSKGNIFSPSIFIIIVLFISS